MSKTERDLREQVAREIEQAGRDRSLHRFDDDPRGDTRHAAYLDAARVARLGYQPEGDDAHE